MFLSHEHQINDWLKRTHGRAHLNNKTTIKNTPIVYLTLFINTIHLLKIRIFIQLI